MTSSTHGASISQAEIANIDKFGFWILVGDKEYFLSFKDYPWFRQATIDNILSVETLHGDHLYWPELDVDLSLDSLSDPDSFPLIYR